MSVDAQIGGPDDGHEKYSASSDKNLLELIGQHDTAKAAFHDLLREVASHPDDLDRAKSAVVTRSEATADSWRELLVLLGSEYGLKSEEFNNAASALWLRDEVERVKLLKQLAVQGKFEVYGNDDIKLFNDLITVTCGLNDKDMVDTLVSTYCTFVDADLCAWDEALRAQAYFEGSKPDAVADKKNKNARSRTRKARCRYRQACHRGLARYNNCKFLQKKNLISIYCISIICALS